MRIQFGRGGKQGQRKGLGKGRGRGRRCGKEPYQDVYPTIDSLFAGGNTGPQSPVVAAASRMSLHTIAVIDSDKCSRCGICIDACLREAIHLTGKGRKDGTAAIDPKKCSGCGLCVNECPGQAISIVTGV